MFSRPSGRLNCFPPKMNPLLSGHDRAPLWRVRSRAAIAAGFTLLELVTVMVVIAILAVLVIGGVQNMQARAGKLHCMMNLRNLSVAANLYVQNQGSWPQIDTNLLADDYPEFCRQWVKAFAPYNISEVNWICPTCQKALGNPDLHDPNNIRLDYTPMPFDDNPRTPYRWPLQPWFIEKNSVHGNGNLIMFTNGSIREALDLIPKSY